MRWLVGIGAALALALVVLLTLPWWLGWTIRPVARFYGASVGRYERVGYSRFALHDVRVQRENVDVAVERVEADTPLVWGWRHMWRHASAISAGNWSVTVRARSVPVPASPSGWLPLRTRLQHIAQTVARWAPAFETGRGTVRFPGGEVSLDAARWANLALEARAFRYRAVVADATVQFSRDDVMVVSARNEPEGNGLKLESRGAEVKGEINAWKQPANLSARFGPAGWLPVQATFQSESFQLPGARLGLGAAYASVSGHAKIEWQRERYDADVTLNGQPIAGKQTPPLQVRLSLEGDRQAATVRALHAELPGAVADLTAPVTLEKNGKIRGTAARFTLRMNLAEQPWFAGKGIIEGDAQVVTGDSPMPVVQFQLKANDVAVKELGVASAAFTGRFAWPNLEIAQSEVRGSAGDGVRGHGRVDLREKRLSDVELEGTVRRASIARWVPASVRFAEATFSVQASGPYLAPNHSGKLQASGIGYGSQNAANVSATWRGVGSAIEGFEVALAWPDAKIEASGAADPQRLKLTRFTFTHAGVERLHLVEPAEISKAPHFVVKEVHLVGPAAEIRGSLDWGPSGRVELVLQGIPRDWIADVVPMRGPRWMLSSFALTGSWDRGPMTFTAAGGLTFELAPQRVAAVNWAMRGDATGIRVDALHAVESGHAVVDATGQFPVHIAPGGKPMVSTDERGALAIDASTVPNAAFWQQLAEMTGVELRAPQMTAHLSGTWLRPRGELKFTADRAAMDPKRFARPMPSIEAVNIALTAEADRIKLDQFSFTVERQLVRASGQLPVPANTWSDLLRAPVPYLQRGAQLRFEVPDAEVAMFSRFLPAALAPVGRFEADLRFDRGTLGGYLRLRDAASRPLGPLGVLQQVSAEVDFSEHRIELRKVTATSGGQPITVSGFVELPAVAWSSGKVPEPKYNVQLRGSNLPFVRQSGLLVRGDLDLKMQSPADGPPGISGQVILRDSLFLTDVRAFLPHGGGASPSRRPPYFSVDTPPLNTWTLGIDVTGTRFMRVRTPVFGGVVSTRFRLSGTLGEPRAIGGATIDEGQVMMPFAAFDVKQGAVRLTEESPYEPTIYLRGTGRHYGYDLAMEISGKASAPAISFTSSPALDSEQVLLMVMTGAAPTNEVSTTLTHRAVQIGEFFGRSLLGSLSGGTDNADRLSIESGAKISRQGRETYDIEYKLNDRWTATGEYDEFDEYNAGFKWRVAPKKRSR